MLFQSGFLLVLCFSLSSACHPRGDTARKFENYMTGRGLDSDHGGRVYSLDCNSSPHQKWEWQSDETIVNVATGKCLDGYGHTINALPCNGRAYQKWLRGGLLEIINKETGWCLESRRNGNIFHNDLGFNAN